MSVKNCRFSYSAVGIAVFTALSSMSIAAEEVKEETAKNSRIERITVSGRSFNDYKVS